MKTLFAGQAYYTNGPFINPENLARYNGMARFTLDPTPDSKLSATVPGLRRRLGRARDRFPRRRWRAAPSTASARSTRPRAAASDRENLILDWRYTPSAADTWEVYAYGTRYKLRLWSDFTFFANSGLRFVQYPNGVIEDTGDAAGAPERQVHPRRQIYQGDSRYMYGGRARYTRNWFLRRASRCRRQLAVETRNDDIHVTLAARRCAAPASSR